MIQLKAIAAFTGKATKLLGRGFFETIFVAYL